MSEPISDESANFRIFLTVGGVALGLAALGGWLADTFDAFDFLASDGLRGALATIGTVILAAGFGNKAQRLWKLDGGWSRRATSHAAVALALTLLLLVMFGVVLFGSGQGSEGQADASASASASASLA